MQCGVGTTDMTYSDAGNGFEAESAQGLGNYHRWGKVLRQAIPVVMQASFQAHRATISAMCTAVTLSVVSLCSHLPMMPPASFTDPLLWTWSCVCRHAHEVQNIHSR